MENDPIDAKDDGLVWYEVLGVTPEQLKPLDQVKEEVARPWSWTRSAISWPKYTRRAGQAAERRQDARRPRQGAQHRSRRSEPLKRTGMAVNILPTAMMQAFSLPQGRLRLGAVRRSTKAASCSRSTRSRHRRRSTSQSADQLKGSSRNFVGEDIIGEYFTALEQRYGVTSTSRRWPSLRAASEEQ